MRAARQEVGGAFIQTYIPDDRSSENPGAIRQAIIDTDGQWLIDQFDLEVAAGARLIMTNTLAGGDANVRVTCNQFTAMVPSVREALLDLIPAWKEANPGIRLMTYMGSTVKLGEGPDSLTGGVSGQPDTHEWAWDRDEIGPANVNGLAAMGFDLIGVDAASDTKFRELFGDADCLARRSGCRLVMEASLLHTEDKYLAEYQMHLSNFGSRRVEFGDDIEVPPGIKAFYWATGSNWVALTAAERHQLHAAYAALGYGVIRSGFELRTELGRPFDIIN